MRLKDVHVDPAGFVCLVVLAKPSHEGEMSSSVSASYKRFPRSWRIAKARS